MRRIFFRFLAGLFLLVIAFALALQTVSFQTWLAQRITTYLADELHTKIHIDRVEIKFISSLVLKGLYVEDLRADTLLYAKELSVNIHKINNRKQILSVSKVTIADADIFLTRYKGEKNDNIQFILDYFESSGNDTTKGEKWKVDFDNIALQNVKFRHHNENDSIKPFGVDFSHLELSNIYGEFRGIHFVNDSIYTRIEKLRFKEKSGFELAEFSGVTKFSSKEISISKLVIKTPFTDIRTNLTFRYDSLSAFDDFVQNVRWKSEFRNSTISFKDIAYFVTDLKGMDNRIVLTGDCKGSVNKFKCKDVTIRFGSQSYFKGDIAMTGLPNIEETYFEIQGDNIVSTKTDIESIPLPPYDSGNHITLPSNLSSLGLVTFKGKFQGFYNDFVAYGNVSTAIGYLSSDLNLKYDRSMKKEFYSGHLIANNFNAGKLTDSKDLGLVSFNADIKGGGLRLDNAEAKMKGVISLLQFRNYSYRNVSLDGTLSKKLFAGSIGIEEPNVDLSFEGQVNFQGNLPEFNFLAKINHLRVDTLKLIPVPGEAELNAQLSINLKGNEIDNLEGEIQINNFNYKTDKRLYHINNISLFSEIISGNPPSSSRLSGNKRALRLTSDLLNADFQGQFEFQTIGNALTRVMPEYFPSLMPEGKRVYSNQDFIFNIFLKNMSLITERFLPAWWIEPNTTIEGRFNALQNTFSVNLSSPLIKFNNLKLVNEELQIEGDGKSIHLNSVAKQIYTSDSIFIHNPVIVADGSMDKIDFKIKLADSVIYQNRAFFGGSLLFKAQKKIRLNFQDASVFLENKRWILEKGNSIDLDSSTITFDHFNFLSEDESIGLKGVISSGKMNENKKLILNFSKFSLSHLNPLISASGDVTFGGQLSGDATISDIFTQPKIISDLKIIDFAFNGDTLGNAAISSSFDNSSKIVRLLVNVLKKDVKTISISGDYNTSLRENNIDLNIQLRNFYIFPYERYIDDVLGDLKGKISTDLKMTGTFDKPILNGYIDFSKSSCRVKYLNTTYSLNDRVWIGKNFFELKNFVLKDDKGNSAIATGKIEHDYFKNIRFNINLETNKLKVLNTSLNDNDIYYGIAYASGTASFTGPIKSLNLDIDLKTEKGTEINLPLGTSSEVERGEFITFINHKDTTTKQFRTPRVNTSGINLNMKLEATPEASIQIIFDEKIGDIIKGNGSGDLTFMLNNAGDFNIYGQYIISKGDYLFTLRNIINKHFDIENGGVISWQGNPYDAEIKLNATYTGSTSSLYKMINDSTYRRRLNYQIILGLGNKLFNPTIKYSINVLGLDAASESRVQSLLNSEAEVSQQVFGLMVLNQFIPVGNNTQNASPIDARSGAGSSAGELLSNQVSNWLGQLSKDVTLGFNYKAADTYSKKEIDLLFSKTLLNDRLSIEGNVGVASDQNTNSLVGDFNAEYSMSENGRFKLKAFNKSNVNNLVYYQTPYTQGVGIIYHKQANSFFELFKASHSLTKDTVQKDSTGVIPVK